MKAHILINPKAGLLKGCTDPEDVNAKLQGLEMDPVITIAEDDDGIQKFIAKVKDQKPKVVLVAGGDGTIATVMKGLIEQSLTFGLIPTGSVNNISQSIGLGDGLEDAIRVINQGHTERMDIGRVNGELFIESVGIGLIAKIMNRVGEQDTKKEVLKVAAGTIAEIMTTETIGVDVLADDRSFSADTVWLTITNTGRAAAAVVDPTSNVHDNRLELVYCDELIATELPGYAMSFIRNSHIQEDKFHRLRAQNIHVNLRRPTEVHVDGVLYTWNDISVDIIPGALEVFVP